MLRRLPTELGIAEDVTFTGFVANRFALLRRADLLVLCSIHEGFGNTLVEGLACGCSVVSTDCPHGPAEILDQGVYGRLVPVGDS
jgi:glycosyltransferase involved in cell wall biosynthesis